MPVKPVKWTTRVFQVPTNFMDQGGLLRFRQQCLPLRPGFEQPAGIRIKAAQSATQCFRQVLKCCGIEGLAIHGHLQIKGILFRHVDRGGMAAALLQGNQSGPILAIGTAEGGISLWQGTVGSVCSQLIQVMGLGRQPIAGQRGGAFLWVEPQGVFQVTQGIGTPLGSDCNTLALTQTQFWLAYGSQRQYPVPWGAAPRPDGLP